MKFLPLLALFALGASACNKAEPTSTTSAPTDAADPHAGLSNYDVDRVAELVGKKEITPVDANNEDTRKEFGTLPGAVLLSSSSDFALTELPPDKSQELVFYCGGEKCTAAPKAAKRAAEAGYRNVHVMRAGIRGWAGAGKEVVKS